MANDHTGRNVTRVQIEQVASDPFLNGLARPPGTIVKDSNGQTWIKFDTGNNDWQLLGVSSWFEQQERKAAALLGVADGDYLTYRTLFESTDVWTVTKGGAGVINRPSIGLEFDTTAAAGSAKINGDANDDSNKYTLVKSDKPFYLAYYAKFTGTATANSNAFVAGLDRGDTENAFRCGVIGALSTTKYTARDDDDTITLTSTVDIDSAYHLFELLLDDNGGRFRVDGETWVTNAGFDTDKDWWFEIGVGNNASTDRVRWQIDSLFLATKRT